MVDRGRLFSAVFLLFVPWVFSEQPVFAQDERRVASPDGQIVFHLFVAAQKDYALPRIAYQVDYRGKRVIETSYMGVDLWEQEPLLGENDGLISYRADSNSSFRSGIAAYMQNGSLGRRIDIEVRAYNEGVAFRYIIHRSAGVRELLVADEATEFALVQPAALPSANVTGSTNPFIVDLRGLGWLSITEVPRPDFPAMRPIHSAGSTYLTRLERSATDARLAFAGTAPFTLPWRVVSIGSDRKCVQESKLAAKLVE